MQLNCTYLPSDVMCTDTYTQSLSTVLFTCQLDIMQASHWYILTTTSCYKDDVTVITQGAEVKFRNSHIT